MLKKSFTSLEVHHIGLVNFRGEIIRRLNTHKGFMKALKRQKHKFLSVSLKYGFSRGLKRFRSYLKIKCVERKSNFFFICFWLLHRSKWC